MKKISALIIAAFCIAVLVVIWVLFPARNTSDAAKDDISKSESTQGSEEMPDTDESSQSQTESENSVEIPEDSAADTPESSENSVEESSVSEPILIENEGEIEIIIPDDMEMDGF